MRIQVYVYGGCVTEVRADSKDVKVEVVDHDNLESEREDHPEQEIAEPAPLPHVVW